MCSLYSDLVESIPVVNILYPLTQDGKTPISQSACHQHTNSNSLYSCKGCKTSFDECGGESFPRCQFLGFPHRSQADGFVHEDLARLSVSTPTLQLQLLLPSSSTTTNNTATTILLLRCCCQYFYLLPLWCTTAYLFIGAFWCWAALRLSIVGTGSTLSSRSGGVMKVV